MTRQDILLLVLSLAGEEGLTPIQLQKSMFLVGQKCTNILDNKYYEFEPHNYGPFCKDIYIDAESSNLSALTKTRRAPGRSWVSYSVTREGAMKAQALEVPQEARDFLRKIVQWTQQVSFGDLVRAIYKAFPDYKVNSVFQG